MESDDLATALLGFAAFVATRLAAGFFATVAVFLLAAVFFAAAFFFVLPGIAFTPGAIMGAARSRPPVR